MEGITDSVCNHTKRICKHFEIKNSGKYLHLYLKSDTLLLADVYVNFTIKCFDIYELDLANFFQLPDQLVKQL